jgi:hypothetical protein
MSCHSAALHSESSDERGGDLNSPGSGRSTKIDDVMLELASTKVALAEIEQKLTAARRDVARGKDVNAALSARVESLTEERDRSWEEVRFLVQIAATSGECRACRRILLAMCRFYGRTDRATVARRVIVENRYSGKSERLRNVFVGWEAHGQGAHAPGPTSLRAAEWQSSYLTESAISMAPR